MFIPTQVSIHTYIPLLYQLREPAKNDFPVATITPSIQIRFPDEMADFTTVAENIQDEPCSARNLSLILAASFGGMALRNFSWFLALIMCYDIFKS